jgi:hypothetical protein
MQLQSSGSKSLFIFLLKTRLVNVAWPHIENGRKIAVYRSVKRP